MIYENKSLKVIKWILHIKQIKTKLKQIKMSLSDVRRYIIKQEETWHLARRYC